MSDSKKGRLIILVAPSGTGKSTMANRLLEELDQIRFSVSATTRKPRPGEVNGKDYYFLTPAQFQKKIDDGEFLEWEEFYNGIRYGTLRADVERLRNMGYSVLLDLEVLGATSIKRMFGDEALSIFLKPPDLDTLEVRLRNRGTETKKTLEERMKRAEKEIRYQDQFDRVIVNDNREKAFGNIKKTVEEFISSGTE